MATTKRKEDRLDKLTAAVGTGSPLRWLPVPEWAVLEDPRVTFLWCDSQRDRMPKVTRKEYDAALQQHLPEVIEAGDVDRSWQAFRARVEERGQWAPGYHDKQRAEWLAQAAAKKQADPLSLLDEYGLPQHPGDRATPEAHRYEQERQRLLAIARSAPVKYFTE
jgi:hypothetical protein